MKQDPPSCSIARLEYFFWMKTLSLAKTRKQTKPKPPEGNLLKDGESGEWQIRGKIDVASVVVAIG